MTEIKMCPFSFNQPVWDRMGCIEEGCMAWRSERRFNDTVEEAPNGEPIIKKAMFLGYCKLIERGL